MSCCLYWVILEERLSVRVLASAVDDDMSCCLYCVILEGRLSVRVLASAVDDESSTALARTRTLGRSSSTTRYKQHNMLPHHHA